VALKLRIMASRGPVRRGVPPALIYRAEVYEDSDRFRECKWGCSHNHESVENAFNCGMSWLNDQIDESAAESA